jgi:small neutral amino acid transporter SnatA (MarC family)
MSIVIVTIIISIIVMMALKKVHDFVRPRNEALVQRYIEIAGRIAALFVGTVAVEMIMQGLSSWMDRL